MVAVLYLSRLFTFYYFIFFIYLLINLLLSVNLFIISYIYLFVYSNTCVCVCFFSCLFLSRNCGGVKPLSMGGLDKLVKKA